MRVIAVAVVFVALCALTAANDFNLRRLHAKLAPPAPPGPDAELFDQRLDHFRPSGKTFKQRFWVNDTFWGGPVGRWVLGWSGVMRRQGFPVFVYVGGEAELRGSVVVAGEIVNLASENGGLLLALEHRFYGESQPFDTHTVDHLQYLSSQQALYDLANFISTTLAVRGAAVVWRC